jgi:hypothetical protein
VGKKYVQRGFWQIKKNVLADARKYKYQSEWARASGGAFTSAKKNGWFEEACRHMQSPKLPMGHWTLDNLIKDAKKYRTRSEWKKASGSAYTSAISKGFLKKCCSHMVRTRKPDGHWSKSRVLKSAQKYETIASWSIAHAGAYDAAKEKGWLNEATRHMARVFSHGEHAIYSLLLQYDISFVYQKRFNDLRDKAPLPLDFYLPDFNLAIEFHGRQHFAISKSSMFKNDFKNMQRRDAIKRKYSKIKGIDYLEIDTPITDEIERAIIQKLSEIATIRGIKLHLAKRRLTRTERQNLVNLGVWTKEAVIADALKFKLLKDWRNCGNAAYQIAHKNGWANEATAHMARSQKPKNYWTKERVLEDAKKYKSKMEWFRSSQSAWATAQRNGWLDECGELMKSSR